MKPTPTGYSPTPLARKLGIRRACHVLLVNAPDGYPRLLEPLPETVVFEHQAGARIDIVQVFVTERADLAQRLPALRKTLRANAILWVSWPKKSSGVPTSVTEDVIRDLALPLGFVDVKVCAVDETWSGLKLVVRKELR